jgi:hypothetical protein
MTSERDVRDRLAEALFRSDGIDRLYGWDKASPSQRRFHLRDAEALLAALPSVGLTISTDHQDDEGRG